MSISDISIGMQILENDWMNNDQDPDTNAPAHENISELDLINLAADACSTIIRVPLDTHSLVMPSTCLRIASKSDSSEISTPFALSVSRLTSL